MTSSLSRSLLASVSGFHCVVFSFFLRGFAMDSASDHSASLQNSVETLREDVSAVQNIVTELLTRFSSSTAPPCSGGADPLGAMPSLANLGTLAESLASNSLAPATRERCSRLRRSVWPITFFTASAFRPSGASRPAHRRRRIR